MKQHLYRIQLEHLTDKDGNPSVQEPLQLEVGNHDDIFKIIELMKARGDFEGNDATAFALGLKLFSEVMMSHRKHPLFSDFAPHFQAFMKQLKQGARD